MINKFKQEVKMKTYVCEKCGKEVQEVVEGSNPNAPHCCGQEMKVKE